MKAYKGFDKEMKCRGFQFKEGETYEEDCAELCKAGFHACENPIDVFRYYAPGESVYHEVDIDGVSPERQKDDSKVCGKKIRIGAAISLRDIIRAGVNMDIEIASKNVKNAATSGVYSPAATSGHSSHAATSGDYSPAATSGVYSPAATSGHSSHAATSGDYSPAATSGDSSPAATSGKDSIAAAIGRNSKAKSSIGNWIVLAEYGEWDGITYPVLCVKCGKIDGESLKPNVWYRLENGEFVETGE